MARCLREWDRPKDILGKIRHVTGQRTCLHDMYLHTGVEELAGSLRCGATLAGLAKPHTALKNIAQPLGEGMLRWQGKGYIVSNAPK